MPSRGESLIHPEHDFYHLADELWNVFIQLQKEGVTGTLPEDEGRVAEAIQTVITRAHQHHPDSNKMKQNLIVFTKRVMTSHCEKFFLQCVLTAIGGAIQSLDN